MKILFLTNLYPPYSIGGYELICESVSHAMQAQGHETFVLTSDHEGTPNVVLEAMASGLPVVTTRVGGVPEIVEQGRSGFVVEPDDEESFTSALRNLIESPDLRMKTGAFRFLTLPNTQ